MLKRRIKLLQSSNSLALQNSPLKVWIASDGTNFNRIPALVLGFKIIRDDLDSPPIQQLLLAKVSESYENIKTIFDYTIGEICSSKSIVVNGVRYEINYVQGGDLKNLNISWGPISNNGDEKCLWCFCHKNSRFDTSKEWSATDPDKGAVFILVL